MVRVFLADSPSTERFALRLFLMDTKMEVVGEAADWYTTLTHTPTSQADILLLGWGLLPANPRSALLKFRKTCPAAQVIVLINHPDIPKQTKIYTSGYTFISKTEAYEHVIESLRAAAASLPPG